VEVLPADTPDHPLNNTKEVSAFLADSINQRRRGELDPRVANGMGYLTTVLPRRGAASWKAIPVLPISPFLDSFRFAVTRPESADSLTPIALPPGSGVARMLTIETAATY